MPHTAAPDTDRATVAQAASQNVTQMSAEERAELLAHLKVKWSSVNSAYQKMTFTLDTPAKQKRKEHYERTLAEIEKDVQVRMRCCSTANTVQ